MHHSETLVRLRREHQLRVRVGVSVAGSAPNGILAEVAAVDARRLRVSRTSLTSVTQPRPLPEARERGASRWLRSLLQPAELPLPVGGPIGRGPGEVGRGVLCISLAGTPQFQMNRDGGAPKARVNAAVNAAGEAYPRRAETSVTLEMGSRRRLVKRRARDRQAAELVPVCARNWRSNVRELLFAACAQVSFVTARSGAARYVRHSDRKGSSRGSETDRAMGVRWRSSCNIRLATAPSRPVTS